VKHKPSIAQAWLKAVPAQGLLLAFPWAHARAKKWHEAPGRLGPPGLELQYAESQHADHADSPATSGSLYLMRITVSVSSGIASSRRSAALRSSS
jgi:hypothetical protein